MSFANMPLVMRVLVVAILAEAVMWLAALAFMAGGFRLLFAAGVAVGMVVVGSRWRQWEWTSDPVTVGLSALARGGIGLLVALLVGIVFETFRTPVALALVAALAAAFPWLRSWRDWEWPRDPVTVSLLLVILALVLVLLLVSPSSIGRLL